MKRVRRFERGWRVPLLGCVALLALMMQTRTTSAHPLGNFTVNLYSRVAVGARQVHIRYVVDLAEIPTFQEFGGGPVSAETQQAYLRRTAPVLRDGLRLSVGGQPQSLALAHQAISFPPGQGNLLTTRLELDLIAALPALASGAQHAIDYRDTNYADRIGWHEIVIQPEAGMSLVRSDAPATDLTNELRVYPQDMLASPPDQRHAQVIAAPGSAPRASQLQRESTATVRANDRFAALIATEQLSPLVVIFALLAALGLGAVHALSPGHGKAVVGAYLIGTRGTARHALFLGLTVTATHTIGVFVLGIITLYASRFILPEQLYPWLGVASGGVVLIMGLTLLRHRVRAIFAARHHDHDHDHDHTHDHTHDHDHNHTHDHHHDHGFGAHTHAVPGADGSTVTWRNLLALGISGGLIPCPSALVVMLSAISLGRVGFGLVLIVAFSLGLAGVLTAIGLLFVHGGRLLGRLTHGQRQPRLEWGLRLLPVLSALVVTTAGVVITAQAMAQAGLWR